MWRYNLLKHKYCLHTSRKKTRQMLKEVDPVGVGASIVFADVRIEVKVLITPGISMDMTSSNRTDFISMGA